MIIDSKEIERYNKGVKNLCLDCVNSGFCKYAKQYHWSCDKHRGIPPGPQAPPMRRNYSEISG